MSDGAVAVREGARGEGRLLDRLGAEGRERLERALADGLVTALNAARRAGGEVLACFTAPVPGGVDPSAIVCASRGRGEPWFCFEQPARGGAAVAALGETLALTSAGEGRFEELAGRWREVRAGTLRVALGAGRGRRGREGARSGGDAGAGERARAPIAVAGFAFSPQGAGTPTWEGFARASLSVPELALVRGEGRTELVLSARVAGDDTHDELHARLRARLAGLRERPLGLLDPDPAGEHRVVSAMPPEHYEAAVARAAEMIGRDELEKVVLAREVQVHAPRPYDPAAIVGALREAFPTCFTFGVGRGAHAFVGASPELLVRREGQRVSTLALAGSARRSADPAVDAHLGERLLRSERLREEHEIVVRRIERSLRRHSLWVATAPEPSLVRVANIQHLGTPVRAQLAEPRELLELAALLHPTPAVGGEPGERALALIPALEGLDRGWYAGPLGYTDGTGDGELCVALRCALLRERVAHCYAGNGIVRGSEPAAELAETELKLQAILPLLVG
jgi:isochorismate synthase